MGKELNFVGLKRKILMEVREGDNCLTWRCEDDIFMKNWGNILDDRFWKENIEKKGRNVNYLKSKFSFHSVLLKQAHKE